MNTQNSGDDRTQDPPFTPRSGRIISMLNSDPDFRGLFLEQLADQEEPESVLPLLDGLTGPLQGEAAQQVSLAVRDVCRNAPSTSLKLAAAAAMMRIERSAEKENELVQTLVGGLEFDTTGDSVRAVKSLANLSAKTRLRDDVWPSLISLVRNTNAEMGARCTALDALVCGHSIPEVKTLVQSMAQADIPVPLRREAKCLLEAWQLVRRIQIPLPIPDRIKEWWASQWASQLALVCSPTNFLSTSKRMTFSATCSKDEFTVMFLEELPISEEADASFEHLESAQPILMAYVSTPQQMTNNHIELFVKTPDLRVEREMKLTKGTGDEGEDTLDQSQWKGHASFGTIAKFFGPEVSQSEASQWEIGIEIKIE